MAPRLADAIEAFTRQYKETHSEVEYGDTVDDREFAEGLEQHLQENFVVLPKELHGRG